VGSWDHVYAEPTNCLRILAVLADGYSSDDQAEKFDTETVENGSDFTPAILTDAEDATVIFIRRVTDPAVFSPGFTDTLSWSLASMLAGPIIKGETGRAEAVRCLGMAQNAYAAATGLSANQAKVDMEFMPSTIAARDQGADVTGTAHITRPWE
jgi:hypothetical protein